MKKKLFMKFENNSIVIGHDTVGVSSIKIEESNIRNGEIILNAQQFNTKNDLKIFYNFKRSIVSYILKNKNMFTNCSF
jgi:hypothetical protein